MEGFSAPVRGLAAGLGALVASSLPAGAQAPAAAGACCVPPVQQLEAGTTTSCVWENLAPPPISRVEAQSVEKDGLVYMFGGFVDLSLVPTHRSDVYDPATDTYTQLADMPRALTHAGIALVRDRIFVAGGFEGPHPGAVRGEVWVYDVLTDTWSAFDPLPEPRGSGQLALTGGALHYFGGVRADRDTDSPDHWTYDLTQPGSGWQSAAPLLPARNHHASIVLGGLVYSIGGQFGHDTSPVDVDLLSVYDPAADAWSPLASLPFPRSHFEPCTTAISPHEIVIVGGRDNQNGAAMLPDVSLYDTWTDSWSNLPSLPLALFAPVAKAVGGKLYVTGGFAAGGPQVVTRVHELGAAVVGPQRINCGGEPFVDSQGHEWCSDQFSWGGTVYESPQEPDVHATDDDVLYHTERYAADADPTTVYYRIPAEPGPYLVRLHFAEIYWGVPGGGQGGAGQRVFDVLLEDQPVLTDYDVYADVGPLTAVVHDFELAVSDGALDVLLSSVADRPKISGIEVVPLGEIGTRYCTGAPNSAGPGARLAVLGTPSVSANLLTLSADGCPAGASGLFLYGTDAVQVPFDAGFLCVGGSLFRVLPTLVTDFAGRASRPLDLHAPAVPEAAILPGSTWSFQLWYRDQPAANANFSDAVRVAFQP